MTDKEKVLSQQKMIKITGITEIKPKSKRMEQPGLVPVTLPAVMAIIVIVINNRRYHGTYGIT